MAAAAAIDLSAPPGAVRGTPVGDTDPGHGIRPL
jgi:hypothetical protein